MHFGLSLGLNEEQCIYFLINNSLSELVFRQRGTFVFPEV